MVVQTTNASILEAEAGKFQVPDQSRASLYDRPYLHTPSQN